MIAVAIILNGISRKKKKFYADIEPVLSKNFSLHIFETERSGHAAELAATAANKGFKYILAAGGDGTLNQVLNGILKSGLLQPLPAIGLIPMGTGNDFARTCGLKADPVRLIKLIEGGSGQPTDVGQLICTNDSGNEQTRYFLNCCSLGMGPEVVKRLENSRRSLGPTHTYIRAIIQTFLTMRPAPVACETNDWKWEGNMRVVAVANGRSFGNAIYIAPNALPDDGLLNVFIAGQVPVIKFLYLLLLIKLKRKVSDKAVQYRLAKQISLTSPVKTSLETEGEQAGFLPATVKVLPHQINFLR
jgi:diacylglycerol kinase (ATP)